MAYSDLISALRAKIGTVWSSEKANGIFHAFQLATIPFERLAEAGNLPVAIMDIDLNPSQEWGADNDVEQGAVSIYYVANDATTPEQIVAKLEALREELWDNGLATGSLQEFPAVKFSMDLPVNQYFLMNQRPFYAGAVILDLIYGNTQ
jgi:hypothetical protein